MVKGQQQRSGHNDLCARKRRFCKFGTPCHGQQDGQNSDCYGRNCFYGCEIIGVDRGIKGTAGSLKGNILTDKKLGEIYENNKFGVYGKLDSAAGDKSDLYQIASADEVHPGKSYNTFYDRHGTKGI